MSLDGARVGARVDACDGGWVGDWVGGGVRVHCITHDIICITWHVCCTLQDDMAILYHNIENARWPAGNVRRP